MERLKLTWQTAREQHQVWHRGARERGIVNTIRVGRLVDGGRWYAEWEGEDAYVYEADEHGKRMVLAKVNEWMLLAPGEWEAM